MPCAFVSAAPGTSSVVKTSAAATGAVVTFGSFTLDAGARQLCRGRDPIHLSPKAFDLLALLVHRRPEALSKSQILDTLWPDTFVSEGNLAVLIKEIRDAIGDTAQRPTFIRRVQRFGSAFSGIATGGRFLQ